MKRKEVEIFLKYFFDRASRHKFLLITNLMHFFMYVFIYSFISADRDSSVDIATAYGLDGTAIESRLGVEIFRTCPDRP